MNQKTNQKNNNNDVDVFTLVEQSFDKVHNNIERLTPAYTQSLSNFQQEILTTWKNLIGYGISVQRQYAEKIGLDTRSGDLLTHAAPRIAEETSRTFEMQSNFVQTFLETSMQNIQRFNENATMYVEFQKKIIDSYMNFSQRTK